MTSPSTVLLSLLVLAGVLATSSALVGAQEGPVVEVHATTDLTFEPKVIEIEPGTTVRWIADEGVFHTVTSSDSNAAGSRQPNGRFDATISGSSPTFEFTFDEEGTFPYYCEPHSANDMIGSVIVKAGATSGADGEPRESPGLGAAALVVALAAMLLVGRRR